MDTWWQTETGAIMISPLPGVTHGKPGSAMKALPGMGADVVDDNGVSVPNGAGGYLVLTQPWPSMLRTIWGDDERYMRHLLGAVQAKGSTSPATARRRTRTATSGSWAASTT